MSKIFKNKFKKRDGFTLIEMVVILGIIIALSAVVFTNFLFFKNKSDLDSNANEIVNVLKLAQSKTLASEGGSSYGVYFNTSTIPHEYILFKGKSYSLRNPSYDKKYKVPDFVEFYDFELGAGNEIIFDRLTGYASSSFLSEKIYLRIKTDYSQTRNIFIEKSGLIGLTSSSSFFEDSRITDSRHVHFNYNGIISTSTDKLILTFNYESSGIVYEIPIVDNFINGQIFWEGEADVNGNLQKIKIHTHKINNPDTQLCVHRDRRYNNVSLSISLFEDSSGDLITYNTSGQETRGTSVFLILGEPGNPQRQ
ncbi:Tfp pilus assembly protein FimT/FimU [Patescibacteria group bacterium]